MTHLAKLTRPAVAAGILIGSGPANAASFDCGLARTPVEVTICRDEVLGELDEKMAARFFNLKSRVPAQTWRQIRRQQKSWLRARNRCGYDDYCITGQYTLRIKELNNWLEEY